MNIVHLISSQGFYGAEAMLVELAAQHASAGNNVTVGTFYDARCPHTEVADVARDRGLRVEFLSCGGCWDGNAVRAFRMLLSRGVDVLHTHGYKADCFGYAAARRERMALVATCHNWPGRRLRMRAYAALDRFILRRFDRVAAVSDPVAAILRRAHVPEPKIATIPNGVDLRRFAAAVPALRSQGPFEGKCLVGFVGRLVDGKGGAVLLRAAKKVIARSPNAVFVFIGEGPQRAEWESLAAQLGIAGSVRFLGACTDMPPLYASLDMLVLPSFEEGSPLSVLEAMAASVPVIASRVGGVPKLVVPGVTGLLVEPQDEDALAQAILRLTEDSTLARRLGENGGSRVAQHFSAGAMARQYLELYSEALTAHSARTGGVQASPSAFELRRRLRPDTVPGKE